LLDLLSETLTVVQHGTIRALGVKALTCKDFSGKGLSVPSGLSLLDWARTLSKDETRRLAHLNA